MENMPALTLNPGEGKTIHVGDSKLWLKLSANQTANAYSITEYELAPQFPGPPPHQHLVFEHSWYVLQGDLTVRLGDKIFSVKEGSFIFIPKQTIHAFANKTNENVRVLVIDTPGGFENYYEDLQAAFGNGEQLDQALMREIQLKYDTYPPDHQFV